MVPMDERETILNYDPMTQMWHAWTNIPAHIRKFDKAGWSRSKTRKYMDNGEEVAVDFIAPETRHHVQGPFQSSGGERTGRRPWFSVARA